MTDTQNWPAHDLGRAMLVPIGVVCKATAMSRSTVYRLVAAGKFPKPVKISPVAVRWRLRDVIGWIETRA